MPFGEEDVRQIAAAISAAEEKRRAYADFWSSGFDRPVGETEIARILTQFLKSQGLAVSELRHRGEGNDPPDCELELESGELIGIEITELVNQKTVERHASAQKRGLPPDPSDVASWTPASLIGGISARLRAKDVPIDKRKGGPFARYVVLISTDEPMIQLDMAWEILRCTPFRTVAIDEAYLLILYHPTDGFGFPEGYPIVKIDVQRERAIA
jgi:hypothetical protein